MISSYFREQKRYTLNGLSDKLACSEEKVVSVIRKLKEYGVLKVVRSTELQRDMSELLDEDIEIADVEVGENEYLYVFTFVGVIVVAGWVLKCYPKYLTRKEKPMEELRQVLKVLEKYNSSEQIIRIFNDSSEGSSFNLLAVFLFLMQDYYENGIYTNTEDIIESNGSGEILWDKTINETFTLLSNNRPYYIDLQTKKRVTDDFDFFTRLHECILSRVSKEMREVDLLDLFELSEIDLSDEELDDFGDKDYILYRIEKELNVQFNTRKQLVLKTVYAYVVNRGSLHDVEGLSLFGTNSFNLVWEGICSNIMDNQLQTKLGMLRLPVPLCSDYDSKIKLIDLIEKPLWTVTGKTAQDTFIPDLVSITKIDDEYHFTILDAKYYTAQLEAGSQPSGQPGIESVAKQYLYQLAYQKFIEDHNFAVVKNCFLMPVEGKEIVDKKSVHMDMFSIFGLQDIEVRLLPAEMVYEHYLSGRHFDIGLLKL